MAPARARASAAPVAVAAGLHARRAPSPAGKVAVMTGPFAVIKTRSAWAQQATEALDLLVEKNSGDSFMHLADAQPVYPVAFGSLIEALNALMPVSDELIQIAGLRPVEEVLGND